MRQFRGKTVREHPRVFPPGLLDEFAYAPRNRFRIQRRFQKVDALGAEHHDEQSAFFAVFCVFFDQARRFFFKGADVWQPGLQVLMGDVMRFLGGALADPHQIEQDADDGKQQRR